MVPLSGSSDITLYRRYRKAGTKLNQKIIDGYLNEAILDEAAQALGLGQNRQLVMDSEDDLSVLMDFALYEIRGADGKNQVERYAAEKGGENRSEKDLLAAMGQTPLGLFRVQSASPQTSTLQLTGLMGAEGFTLTDVNFSQTVLAGTIIFLRPIRLPNLAMTSGIAFAFPEDEEKALCAQWQELAEKGSAELYVAFFKVSKRSRFTTRYETL